MSLRDEFEASGNWLFRRRSFLPLALFVPVAIAMRHYTYPKDEYRLDVDLTVGHTPSGTSGRNTRAQVAASLDTTGMYSVMRHPLYLGNFFMWYGVALLDAVIASEVLGRPRVGPLWAPLLIVGLLISITLVPLERRTRVLRVEGR